MTDEKRQSWHQNVQDVFDEHLHLLPGKRVLHKQREKSKNAHFDYFVMAGDPEPEAVATSPILRYVSEQPGLKVKYLKLVDQASSEAALEDLLFSIIVKRQGAT